jgi:DNA-binding XRE family transcriptional regulator
MAKKVGRPPRIFSELEIAKIKKHAPRLTKKQIADLLGVSENTFREIEKRQPEVSEVYKKAKAEQIDTVVGHLFSLCEQGNVTAIIFFLRTQAGWQDEVIQNTHIPSMNIETVDDETDRAAV